jgi:hypothetical protein
MGALKYRDGGKDFHVFSSHSHRQINMQHACTSTGDIFPPKQICGGKEYTHGLINYIDIKAKCGHLKKLTGKRGFAAGVNHSL